MKTRPPLTFDNVTPAQFEQLREEAQAQGISISGPTGEAEKLGVRVSWAYKNNNLTLQVLHVPFLLSPDNIELRFKAMVQKVQA